MKFKKVNVGRSDILGRQVLSSAPSVGSADVDRWRRNLGYLSMFAGVTAMIASQTPETMAQETEPPVPPQIARQASELVRKLKSGACSKPELLRRQSEYRLPKQKAEYNMFDAVLAGGDTCPGNPIPPGAYTSGTPFTDTGTTVGANNTVDIVANNCIEAPTGSETGFYNGTEGPDHIYSFTLTARGANPQIRVTPGNGSFDTSVYILSNTGTACPAGINNEVINCLTGNDTAFNGGVETLSAAKINSLPLNVPLYLFVDAFYEAPANVAAGPYTVRIQDMTIGGGPTPPANDAPLDMNADGKSDYVVIRNIGGGVSGQLRWYTAYRDGDPTLPTDWGIASDQPVSADFDGDGKDDFAVFRPGNQGVFYIVRSASNTLFSEAFGVAGDDASVVGDYTGDGKADLAVFRGGLAPGDQGFWFYRSIGSASGVQQVAWGQNGDSPAPGDYNNDGKNDFVIQRDDPNGVNGRFFKQLNGGAQSIEIFGLKTDTVVPGDYDGDGSTDIAVVRNDGGFLRWDFEPSGTAGTTVVTDLWGVTATDYVAQGDYDGDGKMDYAVWREGTPGQFFVMTVGTRVITSSGAWGQAGDYPVANYNSH